MFLDLFLNLVGLIVFLFLFWRKLKEDYSREIIFASAFWTVLGLASGSMVGGRYFPGWVFWFEAFGAFLGFSLGVFKYSLRFFEAFEAAFFALLPWLVFLNLIRNLILAGFAVALIGLYLYLNRSYKSFTWYKSGRIGLAGLLVAGAFFLARMILAIFAPHMLSLAGRSEAILSGISAFTIFLLVYNLARSET